MSPTVVLALCARLIQTISFTLCILKEPFCLTFLAQEKSKKQQKSARNSESLRKESVRRGGERSSVS
jgi:hypothetical protein